MVTLEHGIDRTRVVTRLAEEGVPARSYFPPVHEQPYLRQIAQAATGGLGVLKPEGLPVTLDVAGRTLALPFHSNLTTAEVDLVVDALTKASGFSR